MTRQSSLHQNINYVAVQAIQKKMAVYWQLYWWTGTARTWRYNIHQCYMNCINERALLKSSDSIHYCLITAISMARQYKKMVQYPQQCYKYHYIDQSIQKRNIYIFMMDSLVWECLADLGKAKGCSTNTVVFKWLILFLQWVYGPVTPKPLEI